MQKCPRCGKELKKSLSCEGGKVINILLCYWCNYITKEEVCY